MSLPTNIAAYSDVRQAGDSALAEEKGVRVRFATEGGAIRFRQRLYKFRTMDREHSMRLFSPGDDRHGASVYDSLVATIAREGPDFFVEIRKTDFYALSIEAIK